LNLRRGGYLIAKVHQASGRLFSKILRENDIDLNPGQGRILFALWEGDGIPIQELARRTQLGKSTLTSMLDRLERSGQVRRRPSPEDRRSMLVDLTEKNVALREKYARVSREMTELFYRGFSSAEIDEFEGYLGRILANVSDDDKDRQ
jgi:DNA-binding MarR family transcriptional regulator